MNRGFQMKRLILVSVFFLISCGGGGGSDSSSPSSSSSSTSLPAGCCSIYQTAAVQAAYLAGYTGQGSTVLNLDWSTHTNSDGSSHQTVVNGVIAGSGGVATYATLVPVTPATFIPPQPYGTWTAIVSSTLAGMTSGQIINISAGNSDTGSINAPTAVPNIVITMSAGNGGGQTLSESPLNLTVYNSTYKNDLIIVGALGTDGNIASYSATAGAAADRFVVDYGTSTMCTTTNICQGTSYSAPRVAGYAAIIKQKYPNATGSQIASAILNTAVLKPGWDPAIYGKGQVDLTAALKYLGSN